MKNIYQIYIGELSFKASEELLNYLTSPQAHAGIRTEDYWIINTSRQIYNDVSRFDKDIHSLNEMLHALQSQGYMSLMITKEKAPEESEAS